MKKHVETRGRKVDLHTLDPGLRHAVKAMGTISELARCLNISPQAIWQWGKIPVDRLIDVERVTKIDRTKLRPDIFGRRSA